MYALGELDSEEIVQVEQYLKKNPAAVAQLEKIRRADGLLSQTFASEPLPNPPAAAPRIERKPAFSWTSISVWEGVVCLLIVVIAASLILPTFYRAKSGSVPDITVALNEQPAAPQTNSKEISVISGEIDAEFSPAPSDSRPLESSTEPELKSIPKPAYAPAVADSFPIENAPPTNAAPAPAPAIAPAILSDAPAAAESIALPTEALLEEAPTEDLADADVLPDSDSGALPDFEAEAEEAVLDAPLLEKAPVKDKLEANSLNVKMMAEPPAALKSAPPENAAVKKSRQIPFSAPQNEKRQTTLSRQVKGKAALPAAPAADDYILNEITLNAPSGNIPSEENKFISHSHEDIFTFGVDTSADSYAHMRSSVLFNKRPEPGSVRVEEYINYFKYQLPEPTESEACPIAVSCEVGAHPWLPNLYLAKVGLKAKSFEVKDFKPFNQVVLQIEFNPATVKAYRLIGYENRNTAARDFVNDKITSGDMGAGDSIVALYEIVPVGVDVPAQASADNSAADKSRYAQPEEESAAENESSKPESEKKTDSTFNNELFLAKALYKFPESDTLECKEFPVRLPNAAALQTAEQSRDFRFAAAVALYAQLLRHSAYTGSATLNTVKELLQGATENDPRRTEFKTLVEKTPEK